MNIRLTRLKASDAEALLVFEAENRYFFETMVPSRGDAYYMSENFQTRHKQLLKEKDDHDSILGRINVVDLNKQRRGKLGYRIGKMYTGKGLATKGLQLFMKEVIKLDIRKIHAKTTSNNFPSQRVLQKNGFHYEKTDTDSFNMNGEEVKFVYYSWENGRELV
ncbi:GNAT family N-acetyltransferase [Virgibacillus sp. Bac330]|uniref:GNAT family N-acetyltransferase n=1 Tax=Virgibacillus sp. Bac330 TaxID=2419841 RepID=UPI000EF457BE|nr:GNAT family N-acetyltransferase [Virgibacillus sp. Bac330]